MLTKEMIEKLRKLAETHDFKGLPVPQLCELAILGTITRDRWYAEYFQPSAELMHRVMADFAEAKHEWLHKATSEEKARVLYQGRRLENLPTTPKGS